jgi:hypothetical protein
MLIRIGSGELFTLLVELALKLVDQLRLENSMRKATRKMQTAFRSFMVLSRYNRILIVVFYGLWKI